MLTDNLEEACEFLARDYGNPLDIRPIPDDYSVGIDEMRYAYFRLLC